MWIYLGVISAIFLGMYDISRKHALQQNAVLPVLFLSTVCACFLAVPSVIISRFWPQVLPAQIFVPDISALCHFHIFLKAALVAAAWVLSYYAFKNLPISIASPIGATGLIWVLIGSILLFHEHPTVLQYAGLVLMVASYYGFSTIGSKEGIVFYNNKWIVFILLATILNAVSAIYDKYLLQTLAYSPLAVQAWFCVYIVPVLGAVVLVSRMTGEKKSAQFVWRWSIPAIGGFLLAADFVYFRALSCEGSMIAMLSTLRASCIAISLVAGGLLFKELRLSTKVIALAGILGGVCLILLSK